MRKELDEIKVNLEVNHAARMEKVNEAIESLKKTQASEPKETKNSKRLKAMADLLASL